MGATSPVPLSGRRAEAARNDQIILDAARAVFTANPEAPIAAVAERAGVGISALYRRYGSKEGMLQRLAFDGMKRNNAEVEAALADEGDAWEAFARFMERAVAAGSGSMSVRFAGNFVSTDEMQQEGRRGFELTQRLLARTKERGGLRPEIEVGDLQLIFEQLQAVNAGGPERAKALRQRYLAVVLCGLRVTAGPALPGPPPTWEEIRRRYDG
jgi:AcrR family transcriptional regulator